jgi:hypothetical protein
VWRLRASGAGVRIGFFTQGQGPHTDIAKHLIASARKHMPHVDLVQLTDESTPRLEGVKAIRIAGEMPMGVRRLSHYATLEGEWVFLDTDVIFRKDVREVFEKPFDVAVVSREGTYMDGTEYAKVMPYNFGVVFSRSPRFWRMVLTGVRTLPKQLQEWGGEQLVTCELAKRKDFHVEVLPSAYNFTPEKRDEDVSHAAIIHGKGGRKVWLADWASK